MTLTKVEMERIGMTPVAMLQVMPLPVGISIGPQLLNNSNFTDMTIGSELVLNGDFSSATGWSLGPGWSIDTGLGTLTHDGTAKSNTTQSGFTAYQAIKTEIVTDSNAQTQNKALVRETFLQNKWNLSDTAPVTDVNWECNAGSAPTIFSIRDTEENTTSRVFSSISIKPVTLDDWLELGTRTAAEHMCFDDDNGVINIVSGGLQMGITQDLSDGDTYGSELQPNSDLSGTGGSLSGAGTVIGDIADDWYVFADTGMTVTASKDGSDYQVLSFSGSAFGILVDLSYPVSLIIGVLYRAQATFDSVSGSINWRVTSSGGANEQFDIPVTSSGTYTVYFFADTTADVSTRVIGVDGESCTISEVSIKEVTTAVPVFTPGEHYYNVELTGVDGGSVKLATPSDGTLATFNTVGSRANVVTITDPNIRFEANGACNIDVGAVTLYPVIGGVD